MSWMDLAVFGLTGFFALFSILLILMAAFREVFFTIPSNNPTNIEIAVETVLHQAISDLTTLNADRQRFLKMHSKKARRCLAQLAPGLPEFQMGNAQAIYRDCGLGMAAVRKLDSWSRNTRSAAAIEIGALQFIPGIPGLLNLLAGEDVESRAIAARALARIGQPETLAPMLNSFPGTTRASSQAAAELALAFGDCATHELCHVVSYGTERHARLHAIEALGMLLDADAVPLLIEQLKSTDREVRTRAARALGALGDPSAGEPLMDLMTDGAWEVRAAAALSLGKLGIAEASPSLARATLSSSWWVRRNAEEALGKIVTDIAGPEPQSDGESVT